jgi:hypothetical protein
MTEMIFDTCQRLGGYVWFSVVRDLINERWQTIFRSKHPTKSQSFWNTLQIISSLNKIIKNKWSINYFSKCQLSNVVV